MKKFVFWLLIGMKFSNELFINQTPRDKEYTLFEFDFIDFGSLPIEFGDEGECICIFHKTQLLQIRYYSQN